MLRRQEGPVTLEWANDRFTVRLNSRAEVLLWKTCLSSVDSRLRYLPDSHFEARIRLDATGFRRIRERWPDDALSVELSVRELEHLESPEEFWIVYGAPKTRLNDLIEIVGMFRADLVNASFTQINNS
ncbi:hypothetical protein [Herbidospora sp. NBRC 101105]|uniref:hypothetical protein n=1 Tax=Herbidospora sp. NBRC 101105 TaxID=3032195 RepID=UPI0024A4C218|nr:hypothetical protein [Herbidospora sp. NBRC 101105]GLX93457.1 hypothetical protein Hesp01_14070 [Herbidospora sp. NBRC 101105]